MENIILLSLANRGFIKINDLVNETVWIQMKPLSYLIKPTHQTNSSNYYFYIYIANHLYYYM